MSKQNYESTMIAVSVFILLVVLCEICAKDQLMTWSKFIFALHQGRIIWQYCMKSKME